MTAIGSCSGHQQLRGHPIEPVRVSAELASGTYVSIIAVYIFHVNDPLVNRAGLIFLLGEMRSTSHSRKSQQWRNVLHLDAGNEKLCLEANRPEQE